MNTSTIIAITVIAALVVLSVIGSVRKRRKGSSCCGCSMKGSCTKAR